MDLVYAGSPIDYNRPGKLILPIDIIRTIVLQFPSVVNTVACFQICSLEAIGRTTKAGCLGGRI